MILDIQVSLAIELSDENLSLVKVIIMKVCASRFLFSQFMLLILQFNCVSVLSLLFVNMDLLASEDHGLPVQKIMIVKSEKASDPENHAARILSARIAKRSSVSIETGYFSKLSQQINNVDLVIVIGVRDQTESINHLMGEFKAVLPTLPGTKEIHPESYVVKSRQENSQLHVLIAGSEPRSTLYGVGSFLRSITFVKDRIIVPDLDITEKPALWIRGGQPSGPGSRARLYGKLRPRTSEEHQEVMEDLMLLGTNTYGGDPKQLKSYGMMTQFGRTANEMPPGFPRQWGADGGRSPKYVCPSDPEARKALLESFDKMFSEKPEYDFFTTNSGDEGGCRCEKCMPWGGTYIKLLHEISKKLHKYHPDTKILATNQDLTNKGNTQIIDYLNQQDSSWLYALRYGPGADEMQTYIRGKVNPKRFAYEGFGEFGNYLKYLHHALPRETNIALYSDITHWMQSQFAVPKPDIALASVYDRRSWNARPKHFHKIAQEIFHYALGDMHYSEGMHDDFNKWIWYRLMWNPKQDPVSLTKEYCRYWFGEEAQDEIAEAIFLMEETLEKPVLGNSGIKKAVDLLNSAGQKIPGNLLRVDYRWRVISQKALMDRYIQLKLERGESLKKEATKYLLKVKNSDNPKEEIQKAIEILDQEFVTEEMKQVMNRAVQLGEESNKIAGYRVPAMFIVDKLDLSEVDWWKKRLNTALSSGNDSRIKNAVAMILQYKDPGKDGFYENLGWPNQPEHLTHGQWLWGFRPFFGPAKMSQYNLAYSIFEPVGVSVSFKDLDPESQYVLRVSIGAHFGEGEASQMLKGVELKQGIIANGKIISEGFVIPREDVTYQEFDIPLEIMKEGQLDVTFTNNSKFMPITAAYEVWLMKKENMPWKVMKTD